MIIPKWFDEKIMFDISEKECETDSQCSAHHPTGKAY